MKKNKVYIPIIVFLTGFFTGLFLICKGLIGTHDIITGLLETNAIEMSIGCILMFGAMIYWLIVDRK